MRTAKLTIPGLLPGLNQYIAAERSNKYEASAMKKQAENVIGFMVNTQLRDVHFENPVTIHYHWYEPNKRRDKSNIAFAVKFIEDALVKGGVLKDDGWAYVDGFTHSFSIDKGNPRVELEIKETEKSQ
jgi:Holliday junction resolvase RusA-like endonuclease